MTRRIVIILKYGLNIEQYNSTFLEDIVKETTFQFKRETFSSANWNWKEMLGFQ